MALNIKNKQTQQLAKQLAQLTGETASVAVHEAVRERLEKIRARAGLAERLLEIGRDCAAHWKEPYKSMDPDDLLYDDKGLPK